MKRARMLSASLFVFAASLGLMTLGCDKKATSPGAKTPATLTQGELPTGPQGPMGMNGAQMPPPGQDSSVETSSLHVSDAIARACALPKEQSQASFDFDSATISEDDKTMLVAIAKCLTEGALRGRGVALVGRADPRGEDEYNMGLGGSRSESVRKYLHDLGVHDDRLRATSRGEIDATGRDEAGWARDRRVDIELAS